MTKFNKKDLPELKAIYRAEKKQEKSLFSIGITIFLLCFLGISWTSYNILSWKKDNEETDNQIRYLASITTEEISTSNGEVINSNITIDNKENKTAFISVDFTELLKRNSDTKAYLKVNGTNISYPIVQTTDNDYYLTHSFNKSNNKAGWVFLDFRNDINNYDDNMIMYAHGRTNQTMFGSLKNILNSEWQSDPDNHIVRVSTPTENTLWQVFSVYSIPTETYYITTSFDSDAKHQTFINTLLNRSIYNFNTNVDIQDKILTLSTCLNDNEKVVLHAKLIAKQAR
ncbi:MAG: class B sortase [Ruminococcus sp.]|nr:class B sortase [Ruminococcus sp.]